MEPGFYLVKRRKCCVKHFGVLLVRPGGLPPEVFQFSPLGYEITDLAGFAEGKRVKVVDRRPFSEAPAIRGRLATLKSAFPDYHLCRHNCEHAARWVLTGRRESRQVARWAKAAAVLLGVLGLVAGR